MLEREIEVGWNIKRDVKTNKFKKRDRPGRDILKWFRSAVVWQETLGYHNLILNRLKGGVLKCKGQKKRERKNQ